MATGNKRLAVLVGCNYPNTEFRLQGCINDVLAMRDLIIKRFGFDPNNVQLLTDDQGSSLLLTGANIKAALDDMVDQAEPGDVLFFHFSGHGTVIPSLDPGQPFRQDEAIVPSDLNLITNMDLRQLIKRLPIGSSFTIFSDSCHSGGFIDKDKERIGPATVEKTIPSVFVKGRSIPIESIHQCIDSVASLAHGAVGAVDTASSVVQGIGSLFTGIFGRDVSLQFRPQKERDLVKSLTEDEGILLSGCQANETSADVAATPATGGKAHGAFTYAVMQVLEENTGPLTNRELVSRTRKALKDQGFQQHPCLYCSDENADTPFLVSEIQRPKQIDKAFTKRSGKAVAYA
ncbi:hypothetical protein PTKIN_Ptkin16aG0059300 [Pterospermum kingtungense]